MDFFKDVLKKNLVFLAPLADITDQPFRQMVVKNGGLVTYSEMISARALVMGNEKTIRMTQKGPLEKILGVQLFGSDPDEMAEAAVICQELGADFIDVNMGCPQRKIVNSGAGAALLLKPKLAAKIMEKIASRIKIPLTCKTRLGWDTSQKKDICNFAKLMESSGATLIAIHARTKKQMFAGKAQWEEIRYIKEQLSIPVIANGDIVTADDAKRCLEVSNANGVMVGRASLGRPWLIGEINLSLKGECTLRSPDYSGIWRMMRYHLDLIENFYSGPKAIISAKKHLSWYTKGMANSAKFRQKLNEIKNMAEIKIILDSFMYDLCFNSNN